MIRKAIAGLGGLLIGMGVAGSALAGNGEAIAFASIGASGSVISFGGSRTRSATVTHTNPGDYLITFHGRYPRTISADKLILNLTARNGNFDVANGSVVSASPSEIVIEEYTFVASDTSQDSDWDCYATVFLGR